MGSSGIENRSPSFSVTLQTGQPYVVTGVAFGIVQAVDTKLLGILGLVDPEELDVAGGTAVIVRRLELQDVVDLQVKPEPLGLVLALVGHQLPLNGFAELLLGLGPDLRTLLWGTGNPLKLMHILYPGHG